MNTKHKFQSLYVLDLVDFFHPRKVNQIKFNDHRISIHVSAFDFGRSLLNYLFKLCFNDEIMNIILIDQFRILLNITLFVYFTIALTPDNIDI